MKHDDRTNNKILILFVMEKLEIAVTEEILSNICSLENQWMPYFLCQQAIAELKQSGFVTTMKDANGATLLNLTNDGKFCIAHFYKDIPYSLQKEIAQHIKSNRASYKKKQEFYADYEETPNGNYQVNLTISEVSRLLLGLKIEIEDEKTASNICKNWEANAPQIYRKLYENLLED